MEEIAKIGSIKHFYNIPENVKKLFATSHDISPQWHVKMQAAFQKYTHNAVSKTVNFSENASVEDIKEVFWLAYKEGCKGVTIYRSGSRENQVLTSGKKTENMEKIPDINTNNNTETKQLNFDPNELLKNNELMTSGKSRSGERGYIIIPDAKTAIDSLKNAFKRTEKMKIGSTVKCPECSNIIEFVGGCIICRFCGHSMCS